ncbi:hypothetical protein D3C71_1304710 [compost metagenome]
MCAADVGRDVGDANIEFDGDAFKVVVSAIAVDHVAEVEGHGLTAIGIGHDGQPAWIEHAIGCQARQVSGDRQSFGAVFVAVDIEGAADDQVDVATQPAV